LSLFNITLTPTLRGEIIAAQKKDEGMGHIRNRIQEGDPKVACFCEDAEGVLWFKDRLVVPSRTALKKKILDETHTLMYSIHPGSTKIYHDIRQQFWWTRMKRQTTCYVSECDTCRKVKADYMKPRGLLQPLSILDWKWDNNSMDFIVDLPLTAREYNLIWVIVDQLTKFAHFIPFWEQLHASLGTHLIHSSAYNPQMDGETERVNQILEDMLRACVMEYPGSWDKNLPWAKFSYNNSYQESLKMAPFKALYGRQCRTPLNWIEPGEKAIFGPDIVDAAKATVCQIQDNLKAAKPHQESYANKRRRPLQFEVGDHVYLKVSPMKGVKRFGVKGKLSPRYIGPFLVLEKYGKVAYKIELPPSSVGVHDIFHISLLKKCLKAPVDIVLPEVTPLKTDLTYPKHPIKILDQKSRFTRCKTIKLFKIQ
jgi:hypothetical protein